MCEAVGCTSICELNTLDSLLARTARHFTGFVEADSQFDIAIRVTMNTLYCGTM
jgi:hypothetical protein